MHARPFFVGLRVELMMRCQWLRSEEINLGIGRIVNVDAIGRLSAEPMRYMFGFHMESYAVTVEYPNETLFKPLIKHPATVKSRTDRTAKAIVDEEKSAASAKTERLRAARIARDPLL